MGGKVWSAEEEEVFWKQLIPHSPKRLGKDLEENEEKSWHWVAEQMDRIMGDRGRRTYTHLCVCEYLLELFFTFSCRGWNEGVLADFR